MQSIRLMLASITGMASVPALADCAPTFAGGDTSVSIVGVSVEPRASASGILQLRVANAGTQDDSRCQATVRVSRVGSAFSANFPKYVLLAPSNPNVEVLPEGSVGGSPRADIVINDIPSTSAGRVTNLKFHVPTEWGMAAGTFSEQLTFSLYDTQGVLRGRSLVNVAITIPATTQVRFAGLLVEGGQGSRIDLGELSSRRDTRSAPFAARILSTSPYSVSFTSTYGGNLRHEAGIAMVPYELYFDGKRATVGGGSVYTSPTHTSSAGDIKSLQIVVPATLTDAGSYGDRLTILVSAL